MTYGPCETLSLAANVAAGIFTMHTGYDWHALLRRATNMKEGVSRSDKSSLTKTDMKENKSSNPARANLIL